MSESSIRRLSYRRISELKANPANPRRHERAQEEAIAKSIAAFGFNAPILVDRSDKILAGHGRLAAARRLGLTEVPVITLDELSEAQARAYMIADNRLTDRSDWNDDVLAVHLKELSELALDFDMQATGFELPEIDLRIESLVAPAEADGTDNVEFLDGPAISVLGDVWRLDGHRLVCGSALDPASFVALMGDELASATITDPPYNVPIHGHVSGKGAVRHREFKMASGEMAEAEFADFLTSSLELASKLFTDIIMPRGMNGRELADIAVRRHPRLKVLFTTGYSRDAIVHHGQLDPGIHLTKPFTFEDLAKRVRQCLDGEGRIESADC